MPSEVRKQETSKEKSYITHKRNINSIHQWENNIALCKTRNANKSVIYHPSFIKLAKWKVKNVSCCYVWKSVKLEIMKQYILRAK